MKSFDLQLEAALVATMIEMLQEDFSLQPKNHWQQQRRARPGGYSNTMKQQGKTFPGKERFLDHKKAFSDIPANPGPDAVDRKKASAKQWKNRMKPIQSTVKNIRNQQIKTP